MQVDADIDEADVAKVHVGQVAQFTVDAMPTRTFEAVVRQVREVGDQYPERDHL